MLLNSKMESGLESQEMTHIVGVESTQHAALVISSLRSSTSSRRRYQHEAIREDTIIPGIAQFNKLVIQKGAMIIEQKEKERQIEKALLRDVSVPSSSSPLRSSKVAAEEDDWSSSDDESRRTRRSTGLQKKAKDMKSAAHEIVAEKNNRKPSRDSDLDFDDDDDEDNAALFAGFTAPRISATKQFTAGEMHSSGHCRDNDNAPSDDEEDYVTDEATIKSAITTKSGRSLGISTGKLAERMRSTVTKSGSLYGSSMAAADTKQSQSAHRVILGEKSSSSLSSSTTVRSPDNISLRSSSVSRPVPDSASTKNVVRETSNKQSMAASKRPGAANSGTFTGTDSGGLASRIIVKPGQRIVVRPGGRRAQHGNES